MLGKHGHDVIHRLAGAGRARRIGTIPAGLVGEWRYDSSRGPDQDFELTADGYWYICVIAYANGNTAHLQVKTWRSGQVHFDGKRFV